MEYLVIIAVFLALALALCLEPVFELLEKLSDDRQAGKMLEAYRRKDGSL